MALTLSVGFVVDDAIVMLENIVRHIEWAMKPYDAADQGLQRNRLHHPVHDHLLAAVFIPIVFMGGIVGRLLHEFAVTIIIAIVFSGVISVTLTPMLCARMLSRTSTARAQLVLLTGAKTPLTACSPPMTAACAGRSNHGRFILGVFRRSAWSPRWC